MNRWTQWRWHSEHQMSHRMLLDPSGNVLQEEFDIESPPTGPSASRPRYPPASSTLPQRPDGEQEARPENYEYGNTGAGGFSQGSAGQWEGMNSPNTYGSPNPYVSTPVHRSSSIQNTAAPYRAQSISYSSLPRSGSLNQSTAPSGYQYRSPHPQHQAPGRPIAPLQFNTSLSSGQTMQPLYPSQYPSTGQHSSQTSPYQSREAHESSWQTEYYNRYGASNKQMGSLGSQYYNDAPPYLAQPYLTQPGNVPPPEAQVDPSLDPRVSYAKAPSLAFRDEISVIESESERQTSHEREPGSEAIVEIPSLENQQRSQTTKTYPGERPNETGKTSRLHSSALTDFERSSSYNVDPVAEVTRNVGNVSLSRSIDEQAYPPISLSLDADTNKPNIRAPHVVYDRPSPYPEVATRGDMSETSRSHRHPSGAHRHRQRPRHSSITDYSERYSPNQPERKDTGFDTSTFDPPHPSSPQQLPEEQETYEQSQEQQTKLEGKLYSTFKIHDSKEFRKGKVLKLLWSEPVGGGKGATYEEELGTAAPAKFGENAYHSVRRFVVTRTTKGHSLCVPILTYGGQGTAKHGVHANDHAIIYTGSQPEELPGEKKLLKKPVRVTGTSSTDRLDKASRVNYSKIYTVEHNLKVCFIGQIHKDSEAIFFTAAKTMLEGSDEDKPEGKGKGKGKKEKKSK